MRLTRRSFLTAVGATAGSLPRFVGTSANESPLSIYPRVESLLRARADERAHALSSRLELRSADGAFAAALDRVEVARPRVGSQRITPDGLLVFAVDVPVTSWVSAELTLEPDADLRPGLRATLLCDTTVVAAPMSAAPEWSVHEVTDPAPRIDGSAPPAVVSSQPWLARAGRRYITVAGPHFRAGGTFVSLKLRTLDRRVDAPLYQFAFISDTHVRRDGREDWMNRKMGEASAPELARTLASLASEGVAFVIHGGDLTDSATRDQFQLIRAVFAAQPLPVYACLGNHDRYLPASRIDALELLTAHFPDGALDYALHRPPLRFVVMDVAIEDDAIRDQKLDWLRKTLARDTRTPTVFVWHYPPFNRGEVSSCGYRLQDWSELGRTTVLDVLRSSPNVVVAINGHDHWDEVNTVDGLVLVQNAAFVEWPNTYRVYRVYADRIEWEVRQVGNRGFVRESFLPSKAMSWMIATRPTDLSGAIPLTLRV
jgi:predicted phosphodiesterase